MNEPRRIGVFGGTFDPVHNAHCDIARTALAAARLDRVMFVVSARPPHKGDRPFASAEDRYALVQAAVEGEPRFEASRIELDRGGRSYTVDTLREIARGCAGASLFLILGFDSLVDLPKWRDPEGIVSLAHLLVVPRPGPNCDAPPELTGHYDLLPFRETGLSSTEVRDRILGGEPFGHLVPPRVEALIRQKGMYRADHADRAR